MLMHGKNMMKFAATSVKITPTANKSAATVAKIAPRDAKNTAMIVIKCGPIIKAIQQANNKQCKTTHLNQMMRPLLDNLVNRYI